MTAITAQPGLRRPVATTAVSWVAMLGVDLAMHAGVLAPLYDWGSPFLLTPEEAFLRIPAGYAAFALIAAGLAWAWPRLGVRSAAEGARYGAVIGAVGWGALLLATWSIASASPTLLLGWWAGQSLGTAAGGAVIGAAIRGVSLRRLAALSVALLVVGALVAVVLQSIGYATAPVRL